MAHTLWHKVEPKKTPTEPLQKSPPYLQPLEWSTKGRGGAALHSRGRSGGKSEARSNSIVLEKHLLGEQEVWQRIREDSPFGKDAAHQTKDVTRC